MDEKNNKTFKESTPASSLLIGKKVERRNEHTTEGRGERKDK